MLFFDHARRQHLRPKSLGSDRIARAEHQIVEYFSLASAERAQTDVPQVWKTPFERDVTDGLLALTSGKCAFCERNDVRLSPYRFRPPAHAVSRSGIEDKSSYLWLAFNWENLFPICAQCTPGNKNYFPVSGPRVSPPSFSNPRNDTFQGPALDLNEDAVLYYPGELKQPSSYCRVRLNGEMAGSARALETISHFKLNRDELVAARREVFEYEIDALRRDREIWLQRRVAAGVSPAFSGVIYLLLRRIAKKLDATLAHVRNFDVEHITSAFELWFRQDQFTSRLGEALAQLQAEDDGDAVQSYLDDAAETTALPLPAIRLDAPRIKSVVLENYKSLENITFTMEKQLPASAMAAGRQSIPSAVPEAPCLLILGENATGKSSILEAIALACMPDDVREGLKLDTGKLTLNPEYMGGGASESMTTSRVEVSFHDGSRSTLDIDRVNDTIVCTRSGGEAHPLVFTYGAHRLFGKIPREGPTRHVDTLFDDELQISNPEPWLKSLAAEHPKALDEVASALRHIIQIDGYFQNIEVGRDGSTGEECCFINIKKQDGQGERILRQRLGIVSSGYRAILALVCDVFQKLLEATDYSPSAARQAHAIVLIDEIEAHLHPRWKLQVVTGLRRALPRATFILSSHDPLCVRGMFDGEVMMLNRFNQDGGGLREVVEPVRALGNIEMLTIEQLLTSDLFQLFSTDDRRLDETFAKVADILAREQNSEVLDGVERETLEAFRKEIADALPYGHSEVGLIVQEAIAQYLAKRRTRSAARNTAARKRAVQAVKSQLREILA